MVKNYKFCVLLSGSYTHDERVIKISETLSQLGTVDVFCFYNNSKKVEEINEKITVRYTGIKFVPVNKVTNLIVGIWLLLISVLCNKKKYDLIWANDVDTLLPGVILKTTLKSKLVYDSHELWSGFLPDRITGIIWFYIWAYLTIYLTIEKWLINKADLIISANEERMKLLIDRYPKTQDKHTVIHNYPKLTKYTTKIPHEKNSITLVYYGKLNRDVDKFLYALHLLNNKCKKRIKIIILTKQREFRSILYPIVKKYKLYENVRYEGYQPAKKLDDYIKKADYGIVTYHPICTNNKYPEPNKFYRYIMYGVVPITNITYLAHKFRNVVIYCPTRVHQIKNMMEKICKGNKKEYNKKKEMLEKLRKKIVWEDKKIITIIKQVIKDEHEK